MKRRQFLRIGPAGLAPAALPWLARPAHAQERAVLRIVVPYAAGGQTDLLARTLATSLGRSLERSVIVDNRTGAAGLIGTRAVQTAAPDGNTLLFHNAGFVALPLLTKGASYDAAKDFAPVAIVGNGPNFLMVNGKMQLTSPTEVLTQQAKLGKVRFLAVNAKERTALAPDLPTIAETLPGFANDVWFGLLAPAGTPAAQVQALSDALRRALGEPEVRERFQQNYMEPVYKDPRAFAAAIDDSLQFWKVMIAELGLQPT